jgi:type IV pilus assembly protein PilE
MTPKRRDRGFTLIELMIVVVIVGILAGIAYPSYQTYVRKSNRATTQAFLMDAAQRQAQYFLDNRAYAPDLATLFGTATPVPSTVSKFYGTPVVATTAGPPPTFLITATPQGSQAVSGEPALSIDQAGNKLPATHW